MSRLRAFRLEKKLSQAELAQAIGVSTICISRYERGERKISVDTAKKLALVLDVNWISLFEEEGE